MRPKELGTFLATPGGVLVTEPEKRTRSGEWALQRRGGRDGIFKRQSNRKERGTERKGWPHGRRGECTRS